MRRKPVKRTTAFWDTVRAHLGEIDRTLAVISVILAIFGIVIIASAVHTTMEGYGIKYIVIQSVAVILGVAGMFILSALDYERYLKKLCIPLFLATCVLLAATLVIGTGEGSNKSWIRFSFLPIGIQPSEFAKILFIYSFAVHLYFVRDRINKIFTALSLFLHAGIIIGLTFLQKDLLLKYDLLVEQKQPVNQDLSIVIQQALK